MNFDVVGFLMGLVPFLGAFVAIVLLDLIAAVARAVMKKSFIWEFFPEFLLTAANYLMAWLLAEALAVLLIGFGIEISGYNELMADVAPKAVYAIVMLKYAASLVEHIRKALEIKKP